VLPRNILLLAAFILLTAAAGIVGASHLESVRSGPAVPRTATAFVKTVAAR